MTERQYPLMLHIAILHEASEKHGGKALPTEICLAILLRWGGLRHPGVVA